MKYYESNRSIKIDFCCVEMQLAYTGSEYYMDAEMKEITIGKIDEIKFCPFCGSGIEINYTNPTLE